MKRNLYLKTTRKNNKFTIMAKNILITGSNGQLGREVHAKFEGNNAYNLICTDIDELDITNANAVEACISNNKIDYIINCAAYTNVDGAQEDMINCAKLNINAVANLAASAKKYGARIIHISTDYVFDGYNYKPYNEEDRTNPLSTYGTTKLEGERNIKDLASEYMIIRTSWLYSPHGKNFVKTMIRLGDEKENINVVCDQIGTPTSATDLAEAIYKIIDSGKWETGLYHFSNEGAISWYDFTKSIMKIIGNNKCKITPIPSHDYPTPTPRPFYSVLDKKKIKDTYNLNIPYWEDSLIKCIDKLKQQ